MENHEVSTKEIIKFYYQKSTRRPKRLENNVFVIYSPQSIKLQPGEKVTVNMCIKIYLSKNIEGSCRILYSLSNYGLKLLNSNTISQELNLNIDNFFDEHYEKNNSNNLPPWTLVFELFNKNFTETIRIRKRQEIGYFFITNDRGKELDFKYVKET